MAPGENLNLHKGINNMTKHKYIKLCELYLCSCDTYAWQYIHDIFTYTILY